ncbi:Six-bladed beta-propeller protein [Rutstroemia sp. NJR-2017a BVV2]|nr:Six-bladed beta-propeller protein [Rutstroemia sp. NJR-2017a BVV2]
MLALLFLGLLFLQGIRATKTPCVTQIFEFQDDTFIENIHVRANGKLLLTTLSTGSLLTLDPNAATPSPVSVANLTGSTGLTGMATIGSNTYAVSGGVHSLFAFANNSMSVYVVSIPANSNTGTVLDQIPVLNTEMLNGMAALPANPHIVLSVDSIGGRIFRINTISKNVDIAFSDPSLGPGNNALVPLGANGLKIRNGYLYWANSGQGTFARVKINSDGSKAGNVQVIATLSGTISVTNAYDDFAFDNDGNAYVALHSYSVVKITPSGKQTTYVGGGNSTFFKEPTSAALSNDGSFIYVSTGGTVLDGVTYGGQVIQVSV